MVECSTEIFKLIIFESYNVLVVALRPSKSMSHTILSIPDYGVGSILAYILAYMI